MCEGDLLFGSRVGYLWLEYPEKSELWHNAVSSWQPYQAECLMYHVDDRINSGYKELAKYGEVLHNKSLQLIEIDLDDGAKVNYAKFEGLVGKV